MSPQCPVCGAAIHPSQIPCVSGAVCQCSRCRTNLELTASDPLPSTVIALAMATLAGFAFGLHGFVLVIAIAAFGVIARVITQFVWTILAVPKFRATAAQLELPRNPQPATKHCR